jgi:hypothetical protein
MNDVLVVGADPEPAAIGLMRGGAIRVGAEFHGAEETLRRACMAHVLDDFRVIRLERVPGESRHGRGEHALTDAPALVACGNGFVRRVDEELGILDRAHAVGLSARRREGANVIAGPSGLLQAKGEALAEVGCMNPVGAHRQHLVAY